MAIQVDIVSIGQDMDIDTGDVVNRITLRLSDESTVQAIISEGAAKHLVSFLANKRVNGVSAPLPVEPPEPTPSAPMKRVDEDTFEFGGDAAEEQPAQRKPVFVGTDSMGYPIMAGGSSGADPGELADEDGVPSA